MIVSVREELADAQAALDGEEADGILLVGGEVGKERKQAGFQVMRLRRRLDRAREPRQVHRGRAPHHGRVVAAELRKEGAQVLLRRGRHAAVGRGEEAARRDARREPVAAGQAPQQRHKVLEQVVGAELLADLVEGLERLLAHRGLLDGRERLERKQQRGGVRWAAHIAHKVAELIGKRQQDFILVIH